MATELERMGDYAKDVARITIKTAACPPEEITEEIHRLATMSADMLHRAMQAFVADDFETARLIAAEDDEIDALCRQVHDQLVQLMTSDATVAANAHEWLVAVHDLERLADRVTNICERTVYVATGEIVEFDGSAH